MSKDRHQRGTGRTPVRAKKPLTLLEKARRRATAAARRGALDEPQIAEVLEAFRSGLLSDRFDDVDDLADWLSGFVDLRASELAVEIRKRRAGRPS